MEGKKNKVIKKSKEKLKYGINTKNSNKMVYIILMIIIVVVFVIYFVTKDKGVEKNDTTNPVVTTNEEEKDSLSIGIEKYLEFLWIVDGAFNDSRYDSKIKVNSKTIDDDNIIFKCEYDKDEKWCKGKNFENAFNFVFANNITYDDVYGDGLAYKWYEKRGDDYYFKNPNGCSTERMSDNQTIELVNEEKDKLTFKVTYVDNMKTGVYKGEHKINRDFILIKEDDTWKVAKAHYHDLCFQDYYIPKQYN